MKIMKNMDNMGMVEINGDNGENHIIFSSSLIYTMSAITAGQLAAPNWLKYV